MNPERSRRRLLAGGHGALVSTRSDLERGDAPLRALDAETESRYLNEWLRQGGSGCLFAQNRTQESPDLKYLSLAMSSKDLQSITAFDRLQHALRSAQDNDAVLIHLDAPTTEDQLASALVRFGRSEYWFIDTESPPNDPVHVLVKLRWHVPGTFVSSEVLGFADLTSQPPTRRAPTTTLMLRTVAPSGKQPTVHLAQMPYLAHEDARIDFFWQATRAARKALTPSGFHDAAQAPITYRLPRTAWEHARSITT